MPLVKRHIVKTISYRLISTTVGFLTMFALTNSVTIGAAFSGLELIFKPLIYFCHERFWYRFIKYGLKDGNR
jgi:uncharacterized membrane protein